MMKPNHLQQPRQWRSIGLYRRRGVTEGKKKNKREKKERAGGGLKGR